MATALENLKKKVKKTLDDFQASLNFDPSANAGNNFWTSPLGNLAVKAQQGVNAVNQAKRIELPKPQVKNQVAQTAINVAAGIPESIINIPRNVIVGGSRIGTELGESIRDKRNVNLQNLAGGVAPMAEGLFDAVSLGGSSLVKSPVKAIATTAARQAVKKPMIKIVAKGALKGAAMGGGGGLTYGLDKQYGKKFDTKEVLTNVAAGTVLGGVVGGGVAGLGALKGMITRPKQLDQQLRDKAGRWVAGETPIKPDGMPKAQWDFQLKFNERYKRNPYTPVMQSDLEEAIKLEANKRVGLQVRDVSKDRLPTQPQVAPEVPKPAMKIPENIPVKIRPEDPTGKIKIRGFPKTVTENPSTPPEVNAAVKSNPANFYKPITNKEVMTEVSQLIRNNETEALNFARSGTDTKANATAISLLDKYLTEEKFDQAEQLIADVAPRFTKQGQQIQILSMFDRLRPAGAVKYAQTIIDKANKATGGKLKLSPEAVKEISTKAEAIQTLPEGSRERIVATAQLMDSIASTVPPSIGQKIATIQTMAQLLNPKTAVRNTLGNTIFSVGENVSDVVGTAVDKVVGLITGKRTKMLPSLSAQFEGAKRGFSEGLDDALKGIDTSGGEATQFDLPNRTFRTGFLSHVEKALNIELRATDRAAYTAAYEGSLNNQMRAARVAEPTEEMLAVAHADGLYRTFQDNSTLAQLFGGAKKNLNKIGTPDGKFGLGDLILKYPKTPANILSRGLDYSPVGFLKAVYTVARPLLGGEGFDQKTFVENFSRSMVGTGVIAGGYLLAQNGVITGKPEKDKDISGVQRITGRGGFKVNVDALKRFFMSGGKSQQDQEDDTLVSYDWAQPNALQLSMGANIALGGKGIDNVTEIINGLEAGTETLTQQPLVKGITDFASNVKDYGPVNATTRAVLDSASGFVPSLSNQFGQLTDNTSRETYDPSQVNQAKNKIVARIPGARNTLPPKIGVTGQPLETYQGGSNNWFNVFLNPAFVSKIRSNPVADEVLRIFEQSGETQQAPRTAPRKVSVNGQDIALSPKQLTDYQTYIGQKTEQAFSQLIAQPGWTDLSDEDKAQKMANILTNVNTAARIELFGHKPKSISKGVREFLENPPSEINKKTNKKVSVKKTSTSKKSTSAPKISIKKPSARMPTVSFSSPKSKGMKLSSSTPRSVKKVKLKKLTIPKIKVKSNVLKS